MSRFASFIHQLIYHAVANSRKKECWRLVKCCVVALIFGSKIRCSNKYNVKELNTLIGERTQRSTEEYATRHWTEVPSGIFRLSQKVRCLETTLDRTQNFLIWPITLLCYNCFCWTWFFKLVYFRMLGILSLKNNNSIRENIQKSMKLPRYLDQDGEKIAIQRVVERKVVKVWVVKSTQILILITMAEWR